MPGVETQITVTLPDDIATRLGGRGNLSRVALESLAIEGYRTGKLSGGQVKRLLGLGTRLKSRWIFERAWRLFELWLVRLNRRIARLSRHLSANDCGRGCEPRWITLSTSATSICYLRYLAGL